MADTATCVLPNHNIVNGYYNIERMLKSVLNKGGQVKICGTCAGARGIKNLLLIESAQISTMAELFYSLKLFHFLPSLEKHVFHNS